MDIQSCGWMIVSDFPEPENSRQMEQTRKKRLSNYPCWYGPREHSLTCHKGKPAVRQQDTVLISDFQKNDLQQSFLTAVGTGPGFFLGVIQKVRQWDHVHENSQNAHTHTLSLSLSLTHTQVLSLSLTHTHTLSFSLTHILSLSLSFTHTHTFSLSHTHTLSLRLTHTHTFSLPLSHTHTLSPSHAHPHILSLSYTHTLSLPLSHTPTHTLSPSLSHTNILSPLLHTHTLTLSPPLSHTHAQKLKEPTTISMCNIKSRTHHSTHAHYTCDLKSSSSPSTVVNLPPSVPMSASKSSSGICTKHVSLCNTHTHIHPHTHKLWMDIK